MHRRMSRFMRSMCLLVDVPEAGMKPLGKPKNDYQKNRVKLWMPITGQQPVTARLRVHTGNQGPTGGLYVKYFGFIGVESAAEAVEILEQADVAEFFNYAPRKPFKDRMYFEAIIVPGQKPNGTPLVDGDSMEYIAEPLADAMADSWRDHTLPFATRKERSDMRGVLTDPRPKG